MPPLREMFRRLWARPGQTAAARTVELYGWVLLLEGSVLVLFPVWVAALLHLEAPAAQALAFLRLAGLLIAGIGMLYTVSGRLNAEGFVFATLLDRPLVPPLVAGLWWLGLLPGAFAFLFSVQEIVTFAWTLLAWRRSTR